MRPPSTAFPSLAIAVALALMAAAPAAGTIYYRTQTSTENGNGSTSISLTVPSGVAVGDLLIADVDAAGTGAITAPASGWTQQISGAGLTTYSTVHYRVATAADVAGATYAWNLGSSRKAIGRMISYVGVNTATIGAPVTAGNSGTSITFNSVTTPVNNSLVILGAVALNGSGSNETLTPPAATTTRINIGTSSTGSQ